MAYSKQDLSRPQTRVRHKQRDLMMYSLYRSELLNLAAGYSSPALGLAGAFLGACVTLFATFYSVSLQEPTASRILMGAWVFGGLTLVCTVVAIDNWRKARNILNDVMDEPTKNEEEQIRSVQAPKEQIDATQAEQS